MFGNDRFSRSSNNIERVEITGRVEKVTFHNPENNFAIFQVKITGGEVFAVLGSSYRPVYAGENIKAHGAWHEDKKYGKQFKASSITHIELNQLESIERYLGSGVIAGVGKPLARRIVEMFGDKTEDIFNNDHEKLLNVSGVGKVKLIAMKQSWDDNREASTVLRFLHDNNITTGIGIKIYRHYGAATINILQTNPYRLAMDISGIGFLIADGIARRMNIPLDSPQRAEAAIRHVLMEAGELNGFCSVPLNALIDKLGEIGISRENATSQILAMVNERKTLACFSRRDNDICSINDKCFDREYSVYFLISLRELFELEQEIAQRLIILKNHGKSIFSPIDYSKGLAFLKNEKNLNLSSSQQSALQAILANKIAVVTGGPGTGKTTLISSILALINKYSVNSRIALVAPTGRAAKRMQESTGEDARTIHRLLEYDPVGGGFRHNANNKLRLDLLILDEMSMVDARLMRSVLMAIPDSCSIVFVGDIDQISSIGPGNILADMIRSNVITSISLKEIFRQAAESDIINNAHRINSSQMPIFHDKFGSDCWFEGHEDHETLASHIIELYFDKLAKFCKMHRLQLKRDVQILLPMQKGFAGVKYINDKMQEFFSTKDAIAIEDKLLYDGENNKCYIPSDKNRNVERGELKFYVGDKVMQIENNYDKNVFNGDLGIVCDIDDDKIEVLFDEKKIVYGPSEMIQLRLAYAITIHKSQGSEYPIVIMPIMNAHFVMLNKNIIYTGLTRARKLAVVMGQQSAIKRAVGNATNRERYTLLYHWLQRGDCETSRSIKDDKKNNPSDSDLYLL